MGRGTVGFWCMDSQNEQLTARRHVGKWWRKYAHKYISRETELDQTQNNGLQSASTGFKRNVILMHRVR